ncbi:nucleoside monophosphate kinase [Candidatus Woesebacteria bacterium]|nr:nucleoside monophosphate kinase [Candidatus Woesebacteria bacterium]
MKLVLIGIPGAGKSTQGSLLSRQLGVPYLSTGHIFRIIAKEKTTIGRYVKETMNSGLLIPDEETIPIVEDYLSRREYKKGYILDGFPRTLNQAKKFKSDLDKIIYLELPDKEALWRIAYRTEDARDDQTVAAVMKRIEIFNEVTKPVISHFDEKGKLIRIDGTKSIEDVNKEILKLLGKEFYKNKVRSWKQKQKIILAVTGLPGSGKTEATTYFKSKKLPVVHFGNIINDLVAERKLAHTEDVHKLVRMEVREKYGMEAMAVLSKEKIKKSLEKETLVVLDGLYSFEEYQYLKKEFKDVKVVLLVLWADKKLRYDRVEKRKDRRGLANEERDLNEILQANKGPTLAFADFMVINDGSMHDLQAKLEEVYRDVYFSLE